MMDRLSIKILMITVALSLSSAVIAKKAPLNFETAFELYLLQDCGSGDVPPDLYLTTILVNPERVTPLLTQALLKGPDDNLRRTVLNQIEIDYKNLNAYVENDGLARIENKDVLKAARSISKKQYLNMRKNDFEKSYRERALQALARLNTKKSRQVILDFSKMQNQDKDLIKTANEWLTKK